MKKRTVSVMLAALMAASMLSCVTVSAEEGWTREFEGESLTFLDVAPSDTRTAYFENLFARFFEDTGIEVEYQSVPWDDAANKLTVLGASNSLPDVMTMWSGWLGQFTQSGWVVPLSEYIGDTTDEYTAAVTDII